MTPESGYLARLIRLYNRPDRYLVSFICLFLGFPRLFPAARRALLGRFLAFLRRWPAFQPAMVAPSGRFRPFSGHFWRHDALMILARVRAGLADLFSGALIGIEPIGPKETLNRAVLPGHMASTSTCCLGGSPLSRAAPLGDPRRGQDSRKR